MKASPQLKTKAAVGCLCLFWVVLLSCNTTSTASKDRLYVASFGTEPVTEVLVQRKPHAWVVMNGEERINMGRVGFGELYSVPVFGGSWSGEWVGEEWHGHWTDSLRPGDYWVPLKLQPLQIQSAQEGGRQQSSWTTSEGLLLLEEREDSVWATISTPTGDYRYLAGKMESNQLVFSNFDGAHLFRFSATVEGDSMINGTFLSGTHYETSFEGVRLPNKPRVWTSGEQRANGKPLVFRGVNATGDTAVWDEHVLRESGKLGLVVDIMGTWCPNCMDEARLLAELAPLHPDVAFVSLAFERTDDASILPRLRQFETELGLSWDVLLGGRASKRVAAECIGVIDTVHSFPTTLFWSPDSGLVVHKGFHGPATGEGYIAERSFFEAQLNRLSGRKESR